MQRKRPVWVWVITIFYGLSAVWTLLSVYLIWSGSIPLTPEQKVYFDNLTPVDNALTVIVTLLTLSATVALFLLRKVARDLFLAVVALTAAITIWQALTKGWLEALGTSGTVGAAIGYVLLAAVCAYTWHLRRTGVLR